MTSHVEPQREIEMGTEEKSANQIFGEASEMLGNLEKRSKSASQFLVNERKDASAKADKAKKDVTASLARDFMVAIASLDDEVAAIETIDVGDDIALSAMVDGVRMINSEVNKTIEKHGLENTNATVTASADVAEGEPDAPAPEKDDPLSLSLSGGAKKKKFSLEAINPFKGLEVFLGRASEKVEALKAVIGEGDNPELITKMEDEIQRLASLHKEHKGLSSRQEKDIADKTQYGATKLAKDFFCVVDNMDRAVRAAEGQEKSGGDVFKTMLKGVKEARSELIKAFEKNGILCDEPLGKKFDPNFHDGLFQVPGTGKEAGTIVQVEEAGYSLNGRVLRAAKVGFAQ